MFSLECYMYIQMKSIDVTRDDASAYIWAHSKQIQKNKNKCKHKVIYLMRWFNFLCYCFIIKQIHRKLKWNVHLFTRVCVKYTVIHFNLFSTTDVHCLEDELRKFWTYKIYLYRDVWMCNTVALGIIWTFWNYSCPKMSHLKAWLICSK